MFLKASRIAAILLATSPLAATAADVPAKPAALMIVSAQSYLSVIELLEVSGYRVIDMKSTILGRLKIRAANDEHLREVVVSRSTGEIRSDRIIRTFSVDGEGMQQTKPQRQLQDQSTGGVSVGVEAGGAGVSIGLGG